MKSFRSFLIPVACFAATWVLTRFAAGHFSHPAAPVVALPMAPTKTKRERPDPRKTSIEALAEDFGIRPMNQWADRWDEFASETTAEDLQRLPALFAKRRDGHPVQGDDLLQVLAREELATRTGRPVDLTPESFSALADMNAASAWDQLAANHRADFAVAALRTLAGKAPAEALRRYRAMPKAAPEPLGDGSKAEGRRAAVWHTPIGSIFGAWARQDPAAAAAAVMTLPPADRSQAANHLAMTWAFRDGPAAIRYILDFDKSGEGFTSRHLRLDVMLRASFRTHPEETAKLMAGNAMLRKVIGEPPNLYVAVKPWLAADPEGALAWLLDPSNKSSKDAIYWLRLDRQPGIAARIVRALATTDTPTALDLLITMYRREPEAALALADELAIPLRESPRLEAIRIADNPEHACERWLAALHEHDDPKEALAALGWTGEMACELAAQAARAFPDKAALLSKRVPASSLDATNLWRRNNREIANYWPELAGALEYPVPANAKPPFPEASFRFDPAAAAEALLDTDPGVPEVAQAIKLWAPYDLPAARNWLSRLPDGPARQQGQVVLAGIQVSVDPEASLKILEASAGAANTGQLWESAVRRLLYTGGDWQGWLARAPENGRSRLADELAHEAKLLDLARRASRR
ncbi:hypothetical protein OKA05_00295 [Luteolibacter arcticus]|uniref:Lytic murein transglycosylase n=1 Tax=Luteolibacter arcticus TaxID=1581411 RepID=A0ABT3GBG9_9BACT|nr:hypothetical protein [Luteolibacter arcticus]MCW1920971.1 hypothetical protein [Luteolibacter arcticus]